ncbi:hypothetical protein H0H92_006907 [Tricholoma furcatifolium]|nr:hypothetical protein H0H92_006907 [Tricholoma furcatifolium]
MSSDLEHQESLKRQPVISENFHASDADVVFRSSDNVLFRIHRKNLETQAGAFPPPEFKTDGEVISFAENSTTLEYLFCYVYPQLHPDIEELGIEHLYNLAEAAEKYEVYNVMAMCKSRMRQLAETYPSQVFSYAFKHGYSDIMTSAMPPLLDLPLDTAVKSLLPDLVIPWVRNSSLSYDLR